MRKISFRGKTLKQQGMLPAGSWVTGGYYMDDCYGGCPEGKHYIMVWNSSGLSYFEPIQVERESVGQYVGLNDRNGKAVYEGDIVTVLQTDDEDFVRTYEIKMVNGAWCYQRLYGDYHIAKLGDLFGFGRQNFGIKVIGNIFENPELDHSR